MNQNDQKKKLVITLELVKLRELTPEQGTQVPGGVLPCCCTCAHSSGG